MTIVHAAIKREQLQSIAAPVYRLAWDTVFHCDQILGSDFDLDFYISFREEPLGFAGSFIKDTAIGVLNCINIDIGKVETTEQFIYLIAHEFCHMVQLRDRPNEEHHGPFWRRTMSKLGYICDSEFGTLLEDNSKLDFPNDTFEWAPREDRNWAFICERCATLIKGPKGLSAVCNSCEAPFVPITD